MKAEIIDTRGKGWMFDTIGDEEKRERQAGLGHHGTSWYRITPQDATYCLEVLPPIYFAHGFAVSEAAWHDEQGAPTYFAVVRVGKAFYGRHLTVARMEPEARKLAGSFQGVIA